MFVSLIQKLFFSLKYQLTLLYLSLIELNRASREYPVIAVQCPVSIQVTHVLYTLKIPIHQIIHSSYEILAHVIFTEAS